MVEGAVFRRPSSRPLVAFIALSLQLCLAWTSVSGFLHDESDDPVCSPALVLHDHSAHHMGAAKGSALELRHCFICHNSSLRSLVAGTVEWMPAGAEQRLLSAATPLAGAEVTFPRPARAPPHA
jgi:hypothetical protein